MHQQESYFANQEEKKYVYFSERIGKWCTCHLSPSICEQYSLTVGWLSNTYCMYDVLRSVIHLPGEKKRMRNGTVTVRQSSPASCSNMGVLICLNPKQPPSPPSSPTVEGHRFAKAWRGTRTPHSPLISGSGAEAHRGGSWNKALAVLGREAQRAAA